MIRPSRGMATLIGRTGQTPVSAYEEACRDELINSDPRQLSALSRLERLFDELAKGYEPVGAPEVEKSEWKWRGIEYDATGTVVTNDAGSKGEFGGVNRDLNWFDAMGIGALNPFKKDETKIADPTEVKKTVWRSEGAPLGVYLHGGVGCGKSMIMDIFYRCAPTAPDKKKRVHFNEFMLAMHRRLHILNKEFPDYDSMPMLIKEIADQTHVLCFDEFQVTDIGDALIMRRLFGGLFDAGVIMVATSNRAPDELYHNGIQRDLFVPFIGDLKTKCEIHDLASTTDYRLLKEVSTEGVSPPLQRLCPVQYPNLKPWLKPKVRYTHTHLTRKPKHTSRASLRRIHGGWSRSPHSYSSTEGSSRCRSPQQEWLGSPSLTCVKGRWEQRTI